uniref:Uncharacterized protein n=1 Tax=Mola mola TaxID=94237 RepID=A0A3Q3X4A2_MOLML
MSRSEYPPGYDEARGPLYPPQGGNYPAPPAYGFPSYGASNPGQPSAPYPTDPNAPMYPGQPGAYPPGPYPGQPHPAGPVGPDSECTELLKLRPMKSVLSAFVFQVYLILASQLIVTTSIVAVFTFVDPVREFVKRNQAVYWASYAVYFITHLVLVCCTGPRRKHPWNFILLTIFTLALSYMTGTISSFYNTKVVFLAMGITAVVCITVMVFCFQTKVDFTKCHGLFCVLGIVIFVTGIITAIVLSFKYILWLHMLYAALGAIVFTMFLAYHTQLLIGNRKYSISPDEYVFAALSLYVDIIQIFLFLLQIIGASTK